MLKGMLKRALGVVAAAAMAVTGAVALSGTANAAKLTDGEQATYTPSISISGATVGAEFDAYLLATYDNAASTDEENITSVDVFTNTNADVKNAIVAAIDGTYDSDPATGALDGWTEATTEETANPAAWLARQGDDVLRQFAERFQANGLQANETNNPVADENGDATVNVDREGWYLITDTEGRAMVVSTYITVESGQTNAGIYTTLKHKDNTTQDLGVVEAKPKSVPPVTKEPTEDGPFGTGSKVPFSIDITVPNTSGYEDTVYAYTVTDTPSEGLDLPDPNDGSDPEAYTVKNGETVLKYGADYTMTDGEKDAVIFSFVDMTQYAAGSHIIITYEATVTDKATVDNATNTVVVKDPQIDEESQTTSKVTIGGFTFKKTKVDGTTAITDAGFTVYKYDGGTQGAGLVFSGSNGKYRYTGDADGSAAATEISADADGVYDLTGLPKGDYLVVETTTPDGYQDYGLRFVVNVSETGETEKTATYTFTTESNENVLFKPDLDLVTQNGGAGTVITVRNAENFAELPKTGAAGITMFIVLGLLIAGAGVTVYMKSRNVRRMMRA